MNQKTKEFRQNIADIFLKALSEKQLDWKKNWTSTEMTNAVTGKRYNGINKFFLTLNYLEIIGKGENADHRWATFKQIQSKGWKLKKGSKSCKVEYWQPYDFEKKQPITWTDFHQKKLQDNIGLIVKYYHVFNGQDIEGIPTLEKFQNTTVVNDEIIQKISNGMRINITNDGGSRAFYSPTDDSIHLPQKENFYTSYDYNVTALHELSHATGAEHRLHRELGGAFGSAKYAYEELVAEISSCFMSEHLQITQTEEHINNHKAYIQSWIKQIKEKPETLIQAIRDAESVANLLEYHADILTKEEYIKSLIGNMEVPQSQVHSLETETKTDLVQSRKADLKAHCYKPTDTLLKKIEELDNITGKRNTIKDIHSSFKEQTLKDNPDAEKLVCSIEKIFKNQELLKEVPMR